MIFFALVAVTLIQDPSTPLAGMVVTEDGTPVAGADVVLTGSAADQPPVVARGKSGEDGRFRFGRPAAMKPKDQHNAPTLWVVAPGRSVAIVAFSKEKSPTAGSPSVRRTGPQSSCAQVRQSSTGSGSGTNSS